MRDQLPKVWGFRLDREAGPDDRCDRRVCGAQIGVEGTLDQRLREIGQDTLVGSHDESMPVRGSSPPFNALQDQSSPVDGG